MYSSFLVMIICNKTLCLITKILWMSNLCNLSGLKAAGADVDYVVPHRINDGYGINEHLIDNAINEGIDTIVTCG